MKNTISLNENYRFKRLYKFGKKLVTPYIIIYYKKNNINCNRLGITTGRKIGCSVKRNRACRIIKEAYRLCEDDLPKNIDIVIVARQKAVYTKMQYIKKFLKSAFN